MDLKPKMKEIESSLREHTDPMLFQTYKRIILKEESERIERMKLHDMGCSDKCRVKNSMLEMDIKR